MDLVLLTWADLSSALDVETGWWLRARVAGAAANDPAAVTLLVVSHRRPVLRLADQIVVLKDGVVR